MKTSLIALSATALVAAGLMSAPARAAFTSAAVGGDGSRDAEGV